MRVREEGMTRLIDANALKDDILKSAVMIDDRGIQTGYEIAIELIKKQPTIDAEPHWIPCSERLPEEPFGCLVTVWDTDPVTMDEFENILPYFVGWDGEQWNDGDGLQCPFEVIAWMPLPKPYEVNHE
ncbi:MAG TPA: hypothetical protein DEV97_02130 [Lachnospiraceae bacterium]|nr:hypothetical protein [Lachnospiraceae bacterium]